MNVLNKIKWILGILMIFVVVITTNLIDKENFTRVRDTTISIYKDRLVAKDLIFKISNKIQEKEIAAISSNINFYKRKNLTINKEIDNLLYLFDQTYITSDESKVFNRLINEIKSLKSIEESLKDSIESDT